MEEILTVMRWPLVACLVLPGLLAYLGIHILRREIIFVDLALAQVSALGTCCALVLEYDSHDWETFALSLLFTVVGAVILTFTREKQGARVPQEALIGIVYVVAAALGILLLSRSAEGNEELRRSLIGDVLLVSRGEVGRTLALYAAIGVVHFIFRDRFLRISSRESHDSEHSLRAWDFVFYVLFGLAVTSFMRIGGVLLVFSYLIIPAACATYVAEKISSIFLIGWAIASLSSVLGIAVSYGWDLPTGAAIVCTLGGALLVFISVARFRART